MRRARAHTMKTISTQSFSCAFTLCLVHRNLVSVRKTIFVFEKFHSRVFRVRKTKEYRIRPWKVRTMASTDTLQCPLCSQPNFPSIDSLRSSLINVTNRPLICPICNEIQMGLDKLTIHLLSHTVKSSSFVDPCASVPSIHPNVIVAPTSPVTVSGGSIMMDPVEKSTQTFASEVPDCQFCGCTFRSAELRRMHMQLVHELIIDKPASGNDSARFQCTQCPKRFKMEGSLHLHCRMVHGKLSAGVRRMEKRLPIAHKQTKSTAISSGRTTDELPNLKFDGDDSNSGKECSAPATNAIGDEKTFDCTTCSKKFTTKYFLKKHKRLHTGVTQQNASTFFVANC